MLTKNIDLKNFKIKTNNKKVLKNFNVLLNDPPKFFETLKPTYKYSYPKKALSKYKNITNIRIIGMGGSILGSEAIFHFLKKKN